MRPLLYAPLLGLALVPQVQKAATFPNGRVEARGACEIRPESVACWDMDGKPSPDLTDATRATLANNEVGFRLGRKNRVLVVRRSQQMSVQYRVEGQDNVYSNWQSGGDPTTEYLRVAAEPSAATATLRVQSTVQASKDVDLPLREGATGEVEGWTVEVGAAQKVIPKKGDPPVNRGYYYGQPPASTEYWNVVMGLKGREGESVSWAYTPLDAAGAPIRYVDAKGRPLSAIKALALEPSLQPNPNYGYPGAPTGEGARKPKASAAYFQGYGTAPAFRAATNIDPKAIASLRIRASHQKSLDLGPFPLDPK